MTATPLASLTDSATSTTSSVTSQRSHRRLSMEHMREVASDVREYLKRHLSLRSVSQRPQRKSSITADEDVDITQMLHGLSDDEVDIAARSSYEFLKNPQDANRIFYAKEMAKRYLRSKKDPVIAMEKMKATIAFRKEIDVDGLRMAFNDPASEYRGPLKAHLSSKMVYTQGFDKDGRATYIFEPYRTQGHDEEWTIRQHVWTLEKAIACSKAKDKTVNAVVNFAGFSVSKHAPPTHVGKQFLTTLRSHYTGSVNGIFLVDAPTGFLVLWTIFKPFVGRQTKSKIHFVSNHQKESLFGSLYTKEQAKPWMLLNGGKIRDLDVDEYLFKTPFDKAFDDDE